MRQITRLACIIIVLVFTRAYSQVYDETIINPLDFESFNAFGYSCDVTDQFAVVGDPSNKKDADGRNYLYGAGAAYLFAKNAQNEWVQAQKIVASDRAEGAGFGRNVAIWENRVIVGSIGAAMFDSSGNILHGAGAAYIFERDTNGVWSEVQKITASDGTVNDVFGISVSIYGDYALVGAQGDSPPQFWYSVGSAYLFKRDVAGFWTEQQKLTPFDMDTSYDGGFGISVSISADNAIIGAWRDDRDASGTPTYDWAAGSAYIYRKDNNGSWNFEQKVVAFDRRSTIYMGWSVAVDGDRAIVGAYRDWYDATGSNSISLAGGAYIFERDSSGVWRLDQKIVANDRAQGAYFGWAVDIKGNSAIIGAYNDYHDLSGSDTMNGAGAAYLFKRDGTGQWSQRQKIIASNRFEYAEFGHSVCVSENNVLISATEGPSTGGVTYAYKYAADPNVIQGAVFTDANRNCVKDSAEIGMKRIFVQTYPDRFYAMTDSQGNYTVETAPGIYDVIQLIPHSQNLVMIPICPVSPDFYTVDFDTLGQDTSGLDFSNDAILCPFLTVDVSASRMRRCFVNNSSIVYCNDGFADADSVEVHVQFAEYVNLVSASLPYTLDADSNYVFYIGSLDAGACDTIAMQHEVQCVSGITGLTQCFKVWITPPNSCVNQLDTSTQHWDQSFLAIKGVCDRDSVRFAITNTGSSMTGTTDYRVYADGLLVAHGTVQLNAGAVQVVAVYATGQTIRIEVDQRPGAPGNSHPSATIEACGGWNGVIFSTNMVNQLPQDDEDVFVEELCLEIRDSYDPNDKVVYPAGVTENRFVCRGMPLDYIIRFQNTGTDTAYQVVVVDTLSALFDLRTIQFGASSHSYELSVDGKGKPVLTFTFNQINLPDSTTDLLNSNGFLKYKITPYDTIADKSVIHNRAGIYFDFNLPVITNDAWVTISDTIPEGELLISSAPHIHLNSKLIVYPNPARTHLTIELAQLTQVSGKLNIQDAAGRTILKDEVNLSAKRTIDLSIFPEGLYILSIIAPDSIFHSKFVKAD